jgi:hypothetical protein
MMERGGGWNPYLRELFPEWALLLQVKETQPKNRMKTNSSCFMSNAAPPDFGKDRDRIFDGEADDGL